MKIFDKYDIEVMLADLTTVPNISINYERDGIETTGEKVFAEYIKEDDTLRNAPMTWPAFKKALLFLERQDAFKRNFFYIIDKFRDVVGDVEARTLNSANEIIDVIDDAFRSDREFGETDLSWWVYEMDFGRENKDWLTLTDKRFPEDSIFREVCVDNLNILYRYMCAVYALKKEKRK